MNKHEKATGLEKGTGVMADCTCLRCQKSPSLKIEERHRPAVKQGNGAQNSFNVNGSMAWGHSFWFYQTSNPRSLFPPPMRYALPLANSIAQQRRLSWPNWRSGSLCCFWLPWPAIHRRPFSISGGKARSRLREEAGALGEKAEAALAPKPVRK